MPRHIGQAVIATAVAVGGTLVVDPHQVQNRRVKIIHVNRLLHGSHTMFIGRTVDVAALDSRKTAKGSENSKENSKGEENRKGSENRRV